MKSVNTMGAAGNSLLATKGRRRQTGRPTLIGIGLFLSNLGFSLGRTLRSAENSSQRKERERERGEGEIEKQRDRER